MWAIASVPRSPIELSDVKDLKFAPRMLAGPKIDGRLAMGMVGDVRGCPSKRLIHRKQIRSSPLNHLSLSARLAFPNGQLMVALSRNLNIRRIQNTFSIEVNPLPKVRSLQRRVSARNRSQIPEDKLFQRLLFSGSFASTGLRFRRFRCLRLLGR